MKTMKSKPKEFKQFKLKGTKGSLLNKLGGRKRSLPATSSREPEEDALPLGNLIEKSPVDDGQPAIKLKKTLISLTKKTIKKYDMIMSVSYQYDEVDAEKVLNLVRQACSDRLKTIDYLEDNRATQQLRYGLTFDVHELNKALIKGPDGDSEEAKSFREFWGEKSELRRFEDGSIKEAVYWPSKTPKQSRRTVFRIINHVLSSHLGLNDKCIRFEALSLEDFISTNLPVYNIGTGEQFYSQIVKAKDDLERLIKNLDLKLKVIEFKCSSAVFRGTEACIQPPLIDKVQPEHSRKKPHCFKPIELILNVNADSAMWPQKLQPLRTIKLGFYIELYDRLKELNQSNLDARLTNDFVDVLFENFVFRLRLYVPKELTLLQNSVYQNGKLNRSNLRESIIIERELDIVPRITTVLQTLNAKDQNFGLACRLAKKWVAANYLSSLNEIAVELIVYYIHQSNGEAYFIRLFILFLEFLYKFNWYKSPLMVNLNDDFSAEQTQAIEEKFANEREQLPLMVICTPYDSTISQWTKDPINPILPAIYGRILNLAKLSFGIVCQRIAESSGDFQDIFVSPKEVFDCRIVLHQDCVANLAYQVDLSLAKDRNFQLEVKKFHLLCQSCSGKGQLRPGFPLVEHLYPRAFVEVLKETFGQYALFFYNEFGGHMIGVLWKPEAFKPVPFDLAKIKHHKICELAAPDGSLQMELNVDELLEDIQLIGGELIKFIEK